MTHWLLTDWFGVRFGVNIGIEGAAEITELATEYDGTDDIEWELNEAKDEVL